MAALSRSNTSNALLRLLVETLQCLDRLETPSGFSKEHEVVYAKFSVQRTRLVLWGSCLGNEGLRDERSPNEEVTKLQALYNVASVSEPITERYGLRQLLEPETQNSIQRSCSRGFELFRGTFNTYTRRLSEQIGNAKAAEYPKLCVIDVPRFLILIKDLEQCIDDLYTQRNGEESIERTVRWRDRFYEEMSTLAEEPDSLSLLVEASSGPRDAFGNFASRRLLEREGRPLLTLWKRFRTFEDGNDRLIFSFWHRLLDRLVPKRLQGSSSEPPADVRAAASSEETPGKPWGYLAFCSRLGGLHSDLAEC